MTWELWATPEKVILVEQQEGRRGNWLVWLYLEIFRLSCVTWGSKGQGCWSTSNSDFTGVPTVAQQVKYPALPLEDVGWIPGLTHWVQDPVLS